MVVLERTGGVAELVVVKVVVVVDVAEGTVVVTGGTVVLKVESVVVLLSSENVSGVVALALTESECSEP